MADPTEYQRDYDFTLTEKGPALNTELDNLAQTTDETIAALADIRRSDGKLQNGIVTSEALAPGAFDGNAEAAIAAAEAAQAGAETAQAGAETAQEAAETAQTGAETAKGEAETAQAEAAASAASITPSNYVATSLATAATQMLVSTASGIWGAVQATVYGLGFNSLADAAAARAKIELPAVTDDDDLSVDPSNLPTRGNAAAYASGLAIGVGQSWQSVIGSRSTGVAYQNTNGRPIMVSLSADGSVGEAARLEASSDGTTWVTIGTALADRIQVSAVIPDGHYYRFYGGDTINVVAELS